jgi:nitrate/TMAO reductase-like tetraheme cytochrome c subunit
MPDVPREWVYKIRRKIQASNELGTGRFAAGQTCIDCHEGVARTLPPIEQNIGAPKVSEAGTASEPAKSYKY